MAKKNDNSKLVAVLSYLLIGIIWYFVDDKVKKNAFAKFHVKQALNLFIISVGINILSELFMFMELWRVLELAITILAIIGIVFAIQDR